MPIRLKIKKLSKLKKHSNLYVKGKTARHLQDANKVTEHKSNFFFVKFLRILAKVHRFGKRKLLFMLIPHTGKKIIRIPMHLYSICFLGSIIVVLIIISLFSIIDRSGKTVEFYDLGITNEEFDDQVITLAEQMIPMHDVINGYYETLLEISERLGTNPSTKKSFSDLTLFTDALTEDGMAKFKKLLDQCRAEVENDCNKEKIETLLQQVVYLSQADNQRMRQAIVFFDKILTKLNNEEKKNLFRKIPNIWPTNGYLLRSYGDQINAHVGKRIFYRGLDIGSVAGAAVVATAEGTVGRIIYDNELGLNVVISHGYGISTLYANLDHVQVKLDEKIERGQKIGNIGYSIKDQNYKLYYELHIGAVAYDPLVFINVADAIWLNNLTN